jgi:hypothetical protein
MSIDAAFVSFPSLNADRLNLREIQSTDEEAFFFAQVRFRGNEQLRTGTASIA